MIEIMGFWKFLCVSAKSMSTQMCVFVCLIISVCLCACTCVQIYWYVRVYVCACVRVRTLVGESVCVYAWHPQVCVVQYVCKGLSLKCTQIYRHEGLLYTCWHSLRIQMLAHVQTYLNTDTYIQTHIQTHSIVFVHTFHTRACHHIHIHKYKRMQIKTNTHSVRHLHLHSYICQSKLIWYVVVYTYYTCVSHQRLFPGLGQGHRPKPPYTLACIGINGTLPSLYSFRRL